MDEQEILIRILFEAGVRNVDDVFLIIEDAVKRSELQKTGAMSHLDKDIEIFKNLVVSRFHTSKCERQTHRN